MLTSPKSDAGTSGTLSSNHLVLGQLPTNQNVFLPNPPNIPIKSGLLLDYVHTSLLLLGSRRYEEVIWGTEVPESKRSLPRPGDLATQYIIMHIKYLYGLRQAHKIKA